MVLFSALALSACDSVDPDREAEFGDRVTVAYEGRFDDGTVFDQSRRATFTLDGSLIVGFREAVVGMRVGETKTVVIPPERAYGERGQGVIPPNATLTFDIELLDIL